MIHSSSVISKNAKIGNNVKIGPFCNIGDSVQLDDGVELISNVHVEGNTKIGKETKIFPFASIGTAPQDLKYQNEPNSLVIGEKNTIREYVTINPGTSGGGGQTKIGNNCLFMISSHVAHDCQVGDNVIIGAQVGIAGHLKIASGVTLSARSGVTKDINNAELMGGFPALPIKEFRRQKATLSKITKQFKQKKK